MTDSNLRIGIGHDTHRLADGGPLRIGGVDIPHDKHAIIDALLGAANLGDIGEMFPNTEAANRGRDSAEMLRIAMEDVRLAGWVVINLDCIVHAQQPKLSPYKTEIRQRIAEILDLTRDLVGLKGKTGEGVGPVGSEEAIMAQCVALLQRTN